MSTVYALAFVSTLKPMLEPTLTEMSVANPWIEASPAPEMSHTDGSVPVLEFSHTMGLPPTAHGSAALAGLANTATSEDTASASVAPIATERRVARRAMRLMGITPDTGEGRLLQD